MLSFCHWANMSGIFEETENQHRIPQEKLQRNRMHCTHFLALSESLPASMAFTHLVSTQSTWAHGWVAGSEQSSCHPVSCHAALACFTSPDMIACAFCSTSMAGAHHEPGISGVQSCWLGKFCPHGRGKSVLLPALAAQGLSSRRSETLHIALTGSQNLREQCKILPQYSLHESMCSSVEDPKPRMTPKGVSCAEVQQGVEECAALIAATALLPSEPQHKMLSNSTSHSCKLCCVALLCNALLWASQSMAFRA